MESFPNKECRKIIQLYIEFLNKNYKQQMVGEVDGVKASDILALWRPDFWMYALYSGYESVKFKGTLLI